MTARMKGLSESQVLYGHVFRNAMLIVIAGFPPGPSSRAFFGRVSADRDDLLARRAGLLSFESIVNRDYPVVFATLYILLARRSRV